MAFTEGLRHRKSDLYRDTFIIEDDIKPPKKPYKTVPTLAGFAIPILGMVIIIVIGIINKILPTQVAIQDEINQPDRFIGERAEQFLREMIGNGSSRVVGSYENDQLTVQYLQLQIDLIKQLAKPVHRIQSDLQEPVGGYYLDARTSGVQNNYDRIKNVVVRLSSDQDSGHAILMNCHFDSVPESPGASDNGINCAIMLELLKKLTQRDQPLIHNVILLFNGAEENPLQGAHGFIVHHPWAKECRVQVNLDSAGAGGRELLFQTSTKFPWLARMYASVVPHPSGNVVGEELFQSGAIPSDTDFRIFRDFGGLPGFDLAHVDNPFIYHTRLDNMDYIKPGVYQHTGDNLLALLLALGDSNEVGKLSQAPTDADFSKVIYYDFFGAFIVVYSEQIAIFFHVAAIIFSIVSIVWTYRLLPNASKSPWTTFLVATVVQLAGWLLTLAYLIVYAKLFDVFNATMGWHAQLSIISTLYGTPLLFCGIIIPYILNLFYQREVPRDEKVVIYMTGVQFIFTVLLLLGTIFQIRSSYVILMFVAFPAIFALALQAIKLYNVSTAVIAYSVSPLIPIVYVLYITIKAIIFFAPVAARSGVFKNPEFTIVGLVFVGGVLSASYATPLFLLFKSPHKIAATLFILSGAMLVFIITSPFGFPYTGNLSKPALQRFYFMHSERTLRDNTNRVIRNETGFWLIPMDRNDIKYIHRTMPELDEAVHVTQDCKDFLYCGLPAFLPRQALDMPYSYWIPAGAPVIPNPTNLDVVSQTQIDVQTRRIEFNATGPSHLSVFLAPRNSIELVRWSFDDLRPGPGVPWGNRTTYMAYYSCGCEDGVFNFHIDLKIPSSVDLTDPVIDVAVAGFYMHAKNSWTDEYKEFQNKFPEWTNIYRWVSTYSSFVY